MSIPLTEQELHNLAMNIVGKDLEAKGYEFLAVNSKLKKNPQFVAIKDTYMHFIVVRAISYPDAVQEYDPVFMQTIKEHALKFKASTHYAGVGLGHGSDYSKPVLKNEPYSLIYQGLQEIK